MQYVHYNSWSSAISYEIGINGRAIRDISREAVLLYNQVNQLVCSSERVKMGARDRSEPWNINIYNDQIDPVEQGLFKPFLLYVDSLYRKHSLAADGFYFQCREHGGQRRGGA